MPLAIHIRSALQISPLELPGLVFRKCVKRLRYWQMLKRRVRGSSSFRFYRGKLELPSTHRERIIARADAMLRDENTFFSFPYHLHGIERVWEYDPLEKKYWQRRHYTEKHLHAADTPRDVKIVWEFNRFKDLPVLGQAYALTGDERYAGEAIRRMKSWIDGNPFALTINWASALEISIRLISWTTTIALIICHSDQGALWANSERSGELRSGGIFGYSPRDSSTPFVPAPPERTPLGMTATFDQIAGSIYEQARYLAADLSTDKVVPTNHLIGEAAGLFIVSSLWEFPYSKNYVQRAKRILREEIFRQTFEDGVTREASSWYHQFVTDFCDVADRVGAMTGNPFDEPFRTRLAEMKAFLERMTVKGRVVRYGDADDGWALWLEGDREEWMNAIFGTQLPLLKKEGAGGWSSSRGDNHPQPPPSLGGGFRERYYKYAQVVAAHVSDAFLFLRAGTFGMGDAGSSSHAHDDFLSPIIYLAGEPVLADPGTYVYNGNPKDRNRFRIADAHNGIIVGPGTGAEPKLNFGWTIVRPDAKIIDTSFRPQEAIVTAQYGEWAQHRRIIKVNQHSALIVDRFHPSVEQKCTWHFHLDPQWVLREQKFAHYFFQNPAGKNLSITFRGTFDSICPLPYDYSPSYGVLVRANMLECTAAKPSGVNAVLFTIESAQ